MGGTSFVESPEKPDSETAVYPECSHVGTMKRNHACASKVTLATSGREDRF